MTAIGIKSDNYGDSIRVDVWDGQVHVDVSGKEMEGYPSLLPEEARALASVLLAQADAAERTR